MGKPTKHQLKNLYNSLLIKQDNIMRKERLEYLQTVRRFKIMSWVLLGVIVLQLIFK